MKESLRRFCLPFFLILVLVVGLMPVSAVASPYIDEEYSDSSFTSGEMSVNSDDEKESSDAQSTSDDSKSLNTQVGQEDAEKKSKVSSSVGSSPTSEDVKLNAMKSVSVQSGCYLLRPFANKDLSFNIDTLALTSISKQRSNALYISIDHENVATIKNSSGELLTANGFKLSFEAANYSDNQYWEFLSDGETGAIVIKNHLDDSVLDITNGKISNNSKVQLYVANGTVAQKWELEEIGTTIEKLDAKALENKETLADGVYLINSALASDKVLDVANGSTANNANIQLYVSNMTEAQQWRVSHDDQGYVTFTNVKSNKVLDVADGRAMSGTNIQQYQANGSMAQKWIVSKDEQGTYVIESALWPGLTIDVADGSSANGTNIRLYTANGSNAQRFELITTTPCVEPCENLGLEDKYFNIASSDNDDYVFDVASGSTENGANIQLYVKNETYAQLFRFKFIEAVQGMGYYQIINAKSDKALDVVNGNLVSGTNVQLYTADSNNDNQLFRIELKDDGSYCFINKATGLVIDIANVQVQNNANVQVFKRDDSRLQSFSLIEITDFLKEGIVTLSSRLNGKKVVDVVSGSMDNGTGVQLYVANNSLAQKWKVTKVGENCYTFQSLRSGMNLSVSSDNMVIQEMASNSDSQKWSPTIVNGAVSLKNIATGKVLDVQNGLSTDGTKLQVYTYNATNAQLFDVNSIDALSGGTYHIQAFQNIKYVIDIANGSASNGANIQLYQNNDSGAQKWNISKNGDGSYTIKNAANGKVLDVESGNAFDGANIQLYQANGTAAQRWYVEYVENGGFYLLSALDKRYAIAFSGSSCSNGLNAELKTVANSQNQKFSFAKTTYVPPMPADQQAMLNAIKGYSSGTQWLIAVDRTTHKVGVFKGSKNSWSLQYYWSCVTGASSSPTITGSYTTTGFKRDHLTTDSRAIYCTQIWGGYFFHSILASESELGKSLSHGCIRLPYSAASWIYNNINAGTRVVIYN